MAVLKVAVFVAIFSFVLYWYFGNKDYFFNYHDLVSQLLSILGLSASPLKFRSEQSESSSSLNSHSGILLSKEELKKYKYQYLAIVGEVYDVSKGDKHYGREGGYNFFTGIDGTKAFVTGEFNEKGLVDSIEGLDARAIKSIEDWKLMYEKEYKHVGKVIGNFYDANGLETSSKRKYNQLLKDAEQLKKYEEELKKMFPPCNAEFKNRASRVWCSNKSGGYSRSWAGVPRKMFSAGGKDFRCACVRTEGPPSTDMNSKTHKNRGDLDNPNLRLYDNCDPTSNSCSI